MAHRSDVMHSLWTFHLEGGSPFRTKVGGNPSVEHSGATSIFHLVLTDVDADRLTQLAQDIGCQVVARKSRRQTAAQQRERNALLGVGKEDTVWPTQRCPTCYWFDPTKEEPCGVLGWPDEMRRVSLENPKAIVDLEACPLKRM